MPIATSHCPDGIPPKGAPASQLCPASDPEAQGTQRSQGSPHSWVTRAQGGLLSLLQGPCGAASNWENAPTCPLLLPCLTLPCTPATFAQVRQPTSWTQAWARLCFQKTRASQSRTVQDGTPGGHTVTYGQWPGEVVNRSESTRWPRTLSAGLAGLVLLQRQEAFKWKHSSSTMVPKLCTETQQAPQGAQEGCHWVFKLCVCGASSLR